MGLRGVTQFDIDQMEEERKRKAWDGISSSIVEGLKDKERAKKSKRADALALLGTSAKLGVKPQEVESYIASQTKEEPSFLSKIFGGDEQAQPQLPQEDQDIFRNARAKREQEAQRQKMKDSILTKQYEESALPYEQTKKAQEFKYKETAKRQELERKRSEQTFIPSLNAHAQTPQDAKDIKDATQQKEKFDRQLGELINLRKTYGGEVANREAVARSKQLSKDLLLTYKNIAKLGVLSQSDENIINAIIPSDPLEFKPLEALTGQDSIISNLEKFREDTNLDYQTRLKTRLAPNQAGQPSQADPLESKRAMLKALRGE